MKKFLLCLALIMSLCSSAQALITVRTVNKAWSAMSESAGLKNIPIIIDDSKNINSYVKFKSKSDYTVHITKGLMRILDNEAQAAGVFGHEIGHIMLGHYNKNVERNLGWTALGILLSRAKFPARAIGDLGMTLAEKGFSRGQEVEADDYAVNLLIKAGYNPYALYDAMKILAEHNFTSENGFNSHPPTNRRLKHLQDKAKELDSTQ
ncbi:MAG: M48 family metallopeptidase [Synergistaceae bacterium]|nr:M48 family metallopeptidase [Synergistaceae bacterium]